MSFDDFIALLMLLAGSIVGTSLAIGICLVIKHLLF